MYKQNALKIRDLKFNYKNSPDVLKGINLTVDKGGIYGLLGSSGCGKTTLLRCALGRLQPKSGTISLFGQKPGSKESRVPGPGVGYMPQELALYDDFSIEETLIYFGRLFGIKSEIVDSRIDFMVDLLQLPKRQRLVSELSGGQKRRVSIATALLHNPPLLILDEPTVGVDLILREAIWKHLELLCRNGLTVIVTTHYIEEARTAVKVGFMRSGKLLAEDSPDQLLSLYGLTTLEAVFLQLSQLEDDNKLADNLSSDRKSIQIKVTDANMNTIEKTDIQLTDVKEVLFKKRESASAPINGHINKSAIDTNDPMIKFAKRHSIANGLTQLRRESIISNTNSVKRLTALTLKNFKQMSRNLLLLLFFVLLPSIEIMLLIVCIGQDVQSIPVSVYNPEKSSELSETFLKSIDKKNINLIRYKTLEAAIQGVKQNEVWAVIYFQKNFSYSIWYRSYYNVNDQDVINSSHIELRIDMSNQVIGNQVRKHVFNAFIKFADNLGQKYGIDVNSMKPIIETGEPIYGIDEASFNSFIAPGALIVVAYFATTVVTCHLLIKERTDGLVERSLVAGVKPLEFVLSHILLQLFMLTLQVGLKLFFAFTVFAIPNNGSIILASLLVFLQGVCGLMFGLMISALCPDEIYATTLCIGAFFPTVIIGGIFWPLQSMPTGLRYVSQVLPSTLPIESLRSILLRGWGLTQHNVLIGFVITMLWLLFFLVNALTFFVKKL